MVNIGEKPSDIAFQDPADLGVVFASLVAELSKAVHCLMRPLPDLTRIGIGDKDSSKKRIKYSVNRVVQ